MYNDNVIHSCLYRPDIGGTVTIFLPLSRVPPDTAKATIVPTFSVAKIQLDDRRKAHHNRRVCAFVALSCARCPFKKRATYYELRDVQPQGTTPSIFVI